MLSTVLNQSSLPRHRAQHRCRQGLYPNSEFRKVFGMDVSRRKILRVRKWGWGGKQGGLSACAMGAPEKQRMGRKRMLRKGGRASRQHPEVTAGLGCSRCSSGPRPQLPPQCSDSSPVRFSHFSLCIPSWFLYFWHLENCQATLFRAGTV